MPDIKIGRLRGGYCVQWTDPKTGRRRRYQLDAHSRQEAESEGRDRFLKESPSAGDMTICDVWNLYVNWLGDKPTATTMRYTGKSVLGHFGPLCPRHVNDTDCAEYVAARTAAGKSVGTIHTELGHLRSALKWAAQKKRLIDFAPDIPRPPKPDSDVMPLSDAEAMRLIDNCDAPHVRLAVVLALTTAARIGAILDLTWDRIDFDRGNINLRLPDGVTRKGRAVVAMNRMARAALQSAYHARLTDNVIEFGGKRVGSIRTGFNAAVRRAEIGRAVGVHDLRHTAAVKMLTMGIPMEQVSQFLGHSNVHTTRRVYARFSPEHLADAAAVLEFADTPHLVRKVR